MERHRFDAISFVFGLAFLALTVLFVLPEEPWDVYFGRVSLGWLWPIVIIGAGLALLAPVVRMPGNGAELADEVHEADEPATDEHQVG